MFVQSLPLTWFQRESNAALVDRITAEHYARVAPAPHLNDDVPDAKLISQRRRWLELEDDILLIYGETDGGRGKGEVAAH